MRRLQMRRRVYLRTVVYPPSTDRPFVPIRCDPMRRRRRRRTTTFSHRLSKPRRGLTVAFAPPRRRRHVRPSSSKMKMDFFPSIRFESIKLENHASNASDRVDRSRKNTDRSIRSIDPRSVRAFERSFPRANLFLRLFFVPKFLFCFVFFESRTVVYPPPRSLPRKVSKSSEECGAFRTTDRHTID